MNITVLGPKRAIINGTLEDWYFDKSNLKDTERFEHYYDDKSGTLKLGDFNELVNFLIANSVKTDLINSLKK